MTEPDGRGIGVPMSRAPPLLNRLGLTLGSIGLGLRSRLLCNQLPHPSEPRAPGLRQRLLLRLDNRRQDRLQTLWLRSMINDGFVDPLIGVNRLPFAAIKGHEERRILAGSRLHRQVEE